MIINKKRIHDLILFFSIIVIAIVLFFSITLMKKKGNYITVWQNNQLIGCYSIDENQMIPIESDYGYNLLVIEDKKAYIQEADCPDLLCVHQTKIEKNGDMLICLPHKLLIKVSTQKLVVNTEME